MINNILICQLRLTDTTPEVLKQHVVDIEYLNMGSTLDPVVNSTKFLEIQAEQCPST